MTSDGAKGLDKLLVWRKSMDFAVAICRAVIPLLPPEEKYALAGQLRRAAQSIPANIAEGYGRYYYQENIRFCYVARGSLTEVYSHLTLAYRMVYLPEPSYRKCAQDVEELLRILNGYITFLKRTKQGEGEPGHVLHEASSLYDITNQEMDDTSCSLID